MKKFSKEFQVGLLAVVSGVMLYTGYNFLRGRDFFSRDNTFYAWYDNVGGLTVSNQILVNGFAVGQVEAIQIQPKNKNKLLVTLKVDKKIKVPQHTKAMLASGGVLGGKQINLFFQGKNGVLAESGDTLASGVEQGITDIIAEKAEPLAQNVDSTILALKNVLVKFEAMSGDVKDILDNTKATTKNFNGILSDNRQQLRLLTGNLVALTSSLKDTESRFKPILSKLDSFADSLQSMELKQTAHQANEILAQLNKTTQAINSAEGSLGQLIYNDSLYQQLHYTVSDLDRLLVDLREHPQRYVHLSVFGRKDKEKKKEDGKEKNLKEEK